MRKVVIVSAIRTAIGSFGGALKDVSAVDLGVTVVKEALKRASLNPEHVDELIFGNILSAGLGQNVARQVAVKSGIPYSVPSFAINKVCGSGLKSVALAASAIMVGDADIVVAGGTENMSASSYVMPSARFGSKMGHVQVLDTMILDGLTDAFHNIHMGITAENIAEEYKFSREELDLFAYESQQKAARARSEGRFKDEIVPVVIPSKKGDVIFDQDEYIKADTSLEILAKLRPAFKKEGVVTAANSSGLNDGAAALVLMSEDKARELGIAPLVVIDAYASGGVDPLVMGTGPIPATQKALQKAQLKVENIDLIEANEAFAAQSLSVMKSLNLDPKKVNVNGGAIALGHPIGASGARILVTLIHEMLKTDAHRGLATLCIGGGMGISMIVSKP